MTITPTVKKKRRCKISLLFAAVLTLAFTLAVFRAVDAAADDEPSGYVAITFIGNGGLLSKNYIMTPYGEPIGADMPWAVKDGYRLIGWNVRWDGHGREISSKTRIYNDLIVFAIWSPKEDSVMNAMKGLIPKESDRAHIVVNNIVTVNYEILPGGGIILELPMVKIFEIDARSSGIARFDLTPLSGATGVSLPREAFRVWGISGTTLEFIMSYGSVYVLPDDSTYLAEQAISGYVTVQ